MLQVRNLVKQYKAHRAVDDLSFELKAGEIVGLLGPNGAGKTTALRCVAGILRPSEGQILINGHDVVADQAKAKKGLSFVPEVPSLYELLTVDEHLRFIAMCFDTLPIYEERCETLLKRYSLTDKKEALVATLSKGMRQKLSVACALVHDANVLLFDEPLIGIDPEGARELKDELRRARDDGASLLVSTHLLDTAENLCDRVIVMRKGRKIAEGTVADLRGLVPGGETMTLEDVFIQLTHE